MVSFTQDIFRENQAVDLPRGITNTLWSWQRNGYPGRRIPSRSWKCTSARRQGYYIRIQGTRRHWDMLRKHLAWNAAVTPTYLARNSQWSRITRNFELIHLKNLTAAHPRLQRMLLRIQWFDMTIKYKPRTEMLLAEPMSWLSPLPSEQSLNLQEVCLVQFPHARLDTLRQDTSSDPELSALREIIYFGWPEKNRSEFQPICSVGLIYNAAISTGDPRFEMERNIRIAALQIVHC